VLIPVFGGLPVAAVPANLLAVPAAGPVTMWGMTAGVGAGVLGGQAAAVLHLPTRVLVGWTAAVAHVSAGLPLGHIGLALLVVVAIAAALCIALPRAAVVPVVAVAAIAAVIVPPVAARVAPPADIAGRAVTPAARLWRRHGATVVVLSRPPSAGLSSALRRAGVHRLDVLAVPKVDSTMGHALDDIQAAVHPRVILSPPGFHRAHLVVAVAGARVTVGRLRVDVTTAGPPAGYAVAPR
jgi:competence protein ComEC